MGKNVYANGKEVVAKQSDCKVVAAMPDVCLSPPPPPAGPTPLPYPNSSFAKDLREGSKDVAIGGGAVALQDKSYYKTSPLGDEASTKNFGANIIDHANSGKTYNAAYSMDVRVEGKGVPRAMDMATSNHQTAQPPGNPMGVNVGGVVHADDEDDEDQCPCCKARPPHDNQVDPVTKKRYQKVNEEVWYRKGVDVHKSKADGIAPFLSKNPGWDAVPENAAKIQETLRKLREAEEAMATIEAARTAKPPCPNLAQPANRGCGTHFIKTNASPPTSTPKEREKLGFTDKAAALSRRQYREEGFTGPGSKVNHKTPLAAGGCPSGLKNLIPDFALSEECKKLDAAQTKLQGTAAQAWFRK